MNFSVKCFEFFIEIFCISQLNFLDFSVTFFGFFCDFICDFFCISRFLDLLVKFFGVTRLERLKGVKDKVKQTRWAQSRSGPGRRPKSRGPTGP